MSCVMECDRCHVRMPDTEENRNAKEGWWERLEFADEKMDLCGQCSHAFSEFMERGAGSPKETDKP